MVEYSPIRIIILQFWGVVFRTVAGMTSSPRDLALQYPPRRRFSRLRTSVRIAAALTAVAVVIYSNSLTPRLLARAAQRRVLRDCWAIAARERKSRSAQSPKHGFRHFRHYVAALVGELGFQHSAEFVQDCQFRAAAWRQMKLGADDAVEGQNFV